MTDAIFDAAVALVLQHEGGYVNDPADPGGETNFGISKRAYPDLDIAGMTRDKAKAIYFTDFWLRYRINQLPGVQLPCKVLDMAVLIGPATAIRMLQRTLDDVAGPCDVDGAVGDKTVAACRCVDGSALLAELRQRLAAHFEEIVAANPREAKFLAGWNARALA